MSVSIINCSTGLKKTPGRLRLCFRRKQLYMHDDIAGGHNGAGLGTVGLPESK